MKVDPVELAQALIRQPSVTPDAGAALDVYERALKQLGFQSERIKFGDVDNLYARLGEDAPNFCFAGHMDVVPVGDAAAWTVDPFGAVVRDGWLYGRGAADMKAALAAMVSAVSGYLEAHGRPAGSISFLITCDEEGPALDGTRRVLQALKAAGETIDHCLVGEPTSVSQVGDTIKNGRRGSLNAVITSVGVQGHVAYPDRAANPLDPLLEFLNAARTRPLDQGSPGFEPSRLVITTVDVDNTAHNVIPARAEAKLNIRFNTNHSGAMLLAWLSELCVSTEGKYPGTDLQLTARASGEPFYTQPGAFTDLLAMAVRDAVGGAPNLSTSGGTSDARFFKDYCQVAELGLQNETAHSVDERVRVEDVRALASIYEKALMRYFHVQSRPATLTTHAAAATPVAAQ
ncbi:MAG: succinyl-diaminopimelate desuccinylase [Alphaproteobacteria bacterium]|nr:succinyl-diaminopimelate desuccinylase [Alphaproteobacteria bacterium]